MIAVRKASDIDLNRVSSGTQERKSFRY